MYSTKHVWCCWCCHQLPCDCDWIRSAVCLPPPWRNIRSTCRPIFSLDLSPSRSIPVNQNRHSLNSPIYHAC